ncbi:UrcA family protein [Altererythrobacter sp.]|uniref:UrcA family protein n=1 Tax=Altererythrobacter sp. TaxID=1872480 RepID=UPI003D029DC7
MTNRFVTKLACAIASISATFGTFAEVTHAKELEFTYSPAQLATAEGIAKVDQQVRKFARRSCKRVNSLHTPRYRKECRQDIEAQIREKIFAPGKREQVK